MSFWCKVIGHRWEPVDGKCERACGRCGITEDIPHEWHHCACSHCGSLRDERHDWMNTAECEQICRVCGKEREDHRWQPVNRGVDRCRDCGKTHKLTPEEIAKRDEEWEYS